MTKGHDEVSRGAAAAVMQTFEPILPTMQLAGETNRPKKRNIKEIGQ
jgi:hypothetical protein